MSLKTKKLYARVTEDEMKKIIKKAKNGDYKNLSEYLRDKVVNKKIIEYDFGDLNERLSILGDRLNHTVILCHRGVIDTVDMTSFLAEMKQIHKLVSDVKVVEIEND
ncbi:plasmid mobilization protein [Petrocella sp. FN5]|uniref:plasmid mobilization protein n=1 Tax=Petrocella sp. FN5 TaxID=3032002 RepID=UPI000CAAB472|nr:hypothetical protein [Petrocella sp. FN5]MDF1618602.1 hypothetical protein [Petrocella sp. FN5]PKM57453.1 MAG: hypothetical protein CVU98_06065 [Firmicutes bacterium HGW-Firmicutes-3]